MLGDLSSVRDRFPALERAQDGRPCVFVDAPGGTQVPREVIDAMADYLAHHNANDHGAFATSRETDALVTDAHLAAADFLGARPEEVVFGPNATTHLFAVSRAIGRDLGPGDEIVTTVLDHDANIAPWAAIAEDTGATLRRVDIRSEECDLDLTDYEGMINERTRVVAFTLASNAVGTVTPAPVIVDRAHEVGALVVADGVHVAPHRVLDVGVIDADIAVFSPFKVFGPHLGILYGKGEVLRRLRPYRVRPAGPDLPAAFETGTQNHEGMAGYVASVDYLASIGREFGRPKTGHRRDEVVAAMTAIRAYETELSTAFLEGLANIPRARLYGRPLAETRTPTFAVTIEGHHPREVAETLADAGIFAWDGDFYAVALMERLGLAPSGGVVRIGFCHYHTLAEVERVLEVLASASGGAL